MSELIESSTAAPEEEPVDAENPRYIRVDEQRPEGDTGTCLRPLGLCELGGCCDVCWYRHDHPRFRKKSP
jgi:hypothetical protein